MERIVKLESNCGESTDVSSWEVYPKFQFFILVPRKIPVHHLLDEQIYPNI